MNNFRRILFVADISNLYYCTKKRFGGKIDYHRLRERVQELGGLYRAIAYGSNFNGGSNGFLAAIARFGYETKFREPKVFQKDGQQVLKANCDIAMAVDIIEILPSVDVVVLGSADGDFAPLLEYIKSRGKLAYVIGCGISHELKDVADQFIEIDSTLLEQQSGILEKV